MTPCLSFYPHPPHGGCPGQDPEFVLVGFRPTDGMTDDARERLRAQREGLRDGTGQRPQGD